MKYRMIPTPEGMKIARRVQSRWFIPRRRASAKM